LEINNQKGGEALIEEFGDRQFIVDTLNNYEHKFDVASWQYDGIHIWPIIKTICFIKWFYKYNKQIKKGASRMTFGAKVCLLKDSMLEWIQTLLISKKNVAIFATGGDWQNALTDNNQSVNRFLHPIFEEESDDDHVYAQYSDKATYTTSHVSFLKLLALVRVSRITNRFSASDFSKSMADHQEFQQFKIEISEKSKIDFDKILTTSLVSNMREFFAYHQAYKKLLNKYRPKVCMFSGYDKVQNYALIYEANSRNIPTVDVQHGLTGKLHVGYSQFLNIPEGGYNVLPSTFWCWDDDSKKTVDHWAKDSESVQSFVGGNPWLSYTSNQQLPVQLPTDKRILLVTLQHNGIPTVILDAIHNSASHFFWIVRVHPRFSSIKADIEEDLKECIENNNVLVHNAIDIVLPPLLKRVDVHITQFSSTVLEASYLGVPSVVLDPIGVSSYQHLIDQGVVLAYLGDDYNILNSSIGALINTSVAHEYVDVSKGVTRLKQAIFDNSKELGSVI